METFFYICLFVFWTLFWSFASVLVYRLKSGEWWIFNWRSHCTKCSTQLKMLDLIPVFSWLASKGKCKYCKDKVSSIYIFLEIFTWILFILIWYFLIDHTLIYSMDWFEILKLLFWLSIWFISILYIFYDLLFLEIHEWIMLSWIWIILLWLSAQTLIPWFNLIEILPSWISDFWAWLFAIFLTIVIISILYLIMLKELHEIVDIILLILSGSLVYLFLTHTWYNASDIAIINWLMGVFIFFIFFFIQIIISRWKWMWWWDLRIAIMVWLILWVSFSFPWLMLTYMVWSILWILFIIYSKIKNKWAKLNTQIPFWPFIAIWFFITIFYSSQISDLVNIYL